AGHCARSRSAGLLVRRGRDIARRLVTVFAGCCLFENQCSPVVVPLARRRSPLRLLQGLEVPILENASDMTKLEYRFPNRQPACMHSQSAASIQPRATLALRPLA